MKSVLVEVPHRSQSDGVLIDAQYAPVVQALIVQLLAEFEDRKSTRLNSSH